MDKYGNYSAFNLIQTAMKDSNNTYTDKPCKNIPAMINIGPKTLQAWKEAVMIVILKEIKTVN